MSLADEHVEAAQAAGLRYVTDSSPGIRRRRRGRGFAYTRPDGAQVRDAAELERIRKLVIPPRWTDVWICPSATGHLQRSEEHTSDSSHQIISYAVFCLDRKSVV